MLKQEPAHFASVMFDSNNNCNVKCPYCHNSRSEQLFKIEDYQAFLENNVISIHRMQIGCVMEPTLDPRLIEFAEILARSPVKPAGGIKLQTNGILLNKLDLVRLESLGLKELSISIDSANSEVHKSLRGGTSVSRVIRNIESFRKASPNVPVSFITTVTSLNISGIEDLIELGLSLGVSTFTFREVFYFPESTIVDHSQMPKLVLNPLQFSAMQHEVLNQYGDKAQLIFADTERLDTLHKELTANSFRE